MRLKRQPNRIITVLAAAALVVTATAAGDDEEESASTDAGTETTATGTEAAEGGGCETANNEPVIVESFGELDLSDLSITVGSKNFTEQFMLGSLLVVALEETGADVDDQTDTGGTQIVRDALLGGDIDMSWEYNGTGWVEHLQNVEPPSDDPETLTEGVCIQDLEDNNVRWLGRSQFNNTYGFATAPDFLNEDGEPFDMQGMADYLAENSDAVVCMESEFPTREDGLILFEEATGFTVPLDQTQILGIDVIYNETAQGGCAFGEIFTTDGRIVSLGLNLVEDPGVMILYNVSLTMVDETYQQAPEEFQAVADTLLAGLDQETMTELNGRIGAGEDPIDVARDYLSGEGLIEG